VLDPHTAVGYAAARHYAVSRDSDPVVTLATAHPAKFARVIREELRVEPELPAPYRDWQSRQLHALDLASPSYPAFRELLQAVADGFTS
jgi:threonine synthase